MHVLVETTQGLGRKLTIEVPAERIETEVDRRLQRLTKSVKINGFRPGKVPLDVIKKNYEQGVRQEALEIVIDQSFKEAINQENLHVAGLTQAFNTEYSGRGANLKYVAHLEVYPEIALCALNTVSVSQPEIVIDEDNVNEVIEAVRKNATVWQTVARQAAIGDQVDMNVEVWVEGALVKGGSAEHFLVVLGSKQTIPGFEDAVVGVEAGHERVLTLPFPEGYFEKKLAGKTGEFRLKIHQVQTANLPEVDDVLAQKMGAKDLSQMRSDIRQNLEQQANKAIRSRVREQVLEQLLERHSFEIPATLVEAEYRRLMTEAEHHLAEHQNKGETCHHDLPSDEATRVQARKAVALGLVMAKVVEQYGVRVEKADIELRIQEMAKGYAEPTQFIEWCLHNKELIKSLRAQILEDQVVEKILNEAHIDKKGIKFSELFTNNA